ncbi:FAD-dependent oxidoreductase, partial [Cellulomonas triticagri]|uniref:FAD-dependent oxidoreductase n=1 Tax=Cellulomonas triticagri TaxID=2483352 RepID=UPI001F2B4CD3
MDDAQGTTRQDPPTLAWRSGGDPHTASLWLDAPTGPASEPLDGSTTADVVVVGAGLAGLWTAYYLLEHDPALDVLLVEADAVGHGATGRAGGWCSAGSPADAAAVADRHGTEAADAL